MNKFRSRKFIAALSLLATSSLFAVTGYGQDAATTDSKKDDKKDDTLQLDKFVVTGSYIPAAIDEAKALPVQVIDSLAIEATGVDTSVLDVLRKTVPQVSGGNNIGSENANISGGSTNGGSRLSLRNTDTLVLVNGRRLPYAPVASGGGYVFVDVNGIPLSAVDRIEVLTDGASAIYGTDAVSGVVNIILKTDYRGAEASFHYTMAPNDTGGYWRQKSASFLVGTGTDKTNIFFSAEWNHNDPIWERDVAYDKEYYGTVSIPGIVSVGSTYYHLNTSLNSPVTNSGKTISQLVTEGVYSVIGASEAVSLFNLSGRPTIYSEGDKRLVTAAVNHTINDWVRFNADLLYSQTWSKYELNPQPVSVSTTTLIANGITTINTTGLTVRNRFLQGPNRIYDNTTETYRFSVGFDGKVNDYFNWSTYANYNRARQDALGKNQILNSALLAGIYSGLVNMFAYTQDADDLAAANIFGTSEAIYETQLITYNFTANGKIIDLPAGTAYYSAGVEYRKETFSATADYNSIIPEGSSTSLWNNGTSLAPFSGDRHVTAEYAEVKVPVFKDIPGLHLATVSGAFRHESYSDGNSTTVPRVALRYLPFNDELALRATYAKSFSAPDLYSLYGPTSSGFTTSLGSLTSYNSSGVATGNFPNLQGHAKSGSNPALVPQDAKSYTIGFVYSPKFAKGLEITLDYFNIKQTNLIGTAAGSTTMIQSVEQYGADSPYASYVTLNNFANQGGTAVTAPGQLSVDPDKVYVLLTLVNIGKQNQHGFDIGVKYTLPWQQHGVFVIDSRWQCLQEFLLQSNPAYEGFDYLGYDLYGTLPKWRGYTSLDWTYKGYSASLGYTYIGAVDSGYGTHVPSYNVFDISFRYDLSKLASYLKGATVGVGINNITDKQPPLDTDNYSSPPFDASAYSYFGRMYYMDLKIKF